MKKILSLVLVSVLGGAITLGTYKTFLEEKQDVVTTQQQTAPVFIPTNNTVSNTNLTAMENISFVTAAEKTVNAVVHVKNVTIGSKQITLQDLFMGRTQQRRQLGTGSGVIISPDGYIITNNHVIEGSEALSVTLNNNKTFKAEIVGTDPKTDIALLKIEADEDLPYTTFGDSDNAKIGEWVLAVGNPFNLTSTVTAGIISAKSRDLSGNSSQSFIQTDAAVNPGNSGGALVNANGELIGINTAITSQTGSYVGYSFAVPSNIARKVIQDIMEYGNVQNGILGISGNSLSSGFAEKFGLSETEGVYVDDVEEDTGAFDAGLQSGDIIKEIDGIKIRKFSDLKGYINSKRPNDIINVKIIRAGNKIDLPVKLSKSELIKTNFLDLELINVPKNIIEKYDIDGGVFVNKTDNYELYRKLGIKGGYVITKINNLKIDDIQDIISLKKNYKNDKEKYDINSISVITDKGFRERFIFQSN